MLRTQLLVAVAAFLSGCGLGASEDPAVYRSTVSELQSAVTAHQTDGASATSGSCAAEHQRYDELVRPGLERLQGFNPTMMGCRSMRAGMGMGSMCSSMRSELDRHAAAACSSDEATNHAEVVAHCRRMSDWLAQQAQVCPP